MVSLTSTLFVILIMAIPVIMYVAGRCTVMPADETWYDGLNYGKKPDIMYNKFGLLLAIIFNVILGAGFLYLGKLMIRTFQDKRGASITPTGKKTGITGLDFSNAKYKKTWIDWILFLCMPIMLCLYAIAFPLMCHYRSVITGAILNVVPGAFFLLFGIFVGIKYRWVVGTLIGIFGLALIANSVILFMVPSS